MLQRRPYPNVKKPISLSTTKEIGAKFSPSMGILPRKRRNFFVCQKSEILLRKGQNFALTRAEFRSGDDIIFCSQFKGKVLHRKSAISLQRGFFFFEKANISPRTGRKRVPKMVKFRPDERIFGNRRHHFVQKFKKQISTVSPLMTKKFIPERASFFATRAQLT